MNRLLSERLRAGVECAPWVIEEVRKLEAAATTDNHELGVLQAMLQNIEELMSIGFLDIVEPPLADRAKALRAAIALLTRTDAGAHKGVIPEALDETINGVVSDLQMIAAGKDQVTGDPVSGLQSQRIAKSAHDRLLAAWNACEDAAPVADGAVVWAVYHDKGNGYQRSWDYIGEEGPARVKAANCNAANAEYGGSSDAYKVIPLSIHLQDGSGHTSHRDAIDAAMQQSKESAP